MRTYLLPIVAVSVAFGLVLATVTLFYSERLQRSITWRSDAWFNRVSSQQIQLERETLALWARGLSLSPKGQTLLLGDSHLHGLPGNALNANVLNLAIGGLTAQRLEGYLSNGELVLPESAQRVLLLGHNDLNTATPADALEKSISKLIERLRKDSTLVVLEMLPRPRALSTDASLERSRVINSILRRACESGSKPNVVNHCRWVPATPFKGADGFLKPEFGLPSDVHLSLEGYRALIDFIAHQQVSTMHRELPSERSRQ
jgi:lysophospholipase L1-like esterase